MATGAGNVQESDGHFRGLTPREHKVQGTEGTGQHLGESTWPSRKLRLVSGEGGLSDSFQQWFAEALFMFRAKHLVVGQRVFHRHKPQRVEPRPVLLELGDVVRAGHPALTLTGRGRASRAHFGGQGEPTAAAQTC